MTNISTIQVIFIRALFGLLALFVFAGGLHAQQITADKERIITTVRFLSEAVFPRTTTYAHKEDTIDYIIEAFTSAELEATRDEFALTQIIGNSDFSVRPSERSKESIEFEVGRASLTNIHALKKGKTNRRIIIAAHYDAIHESPGADDNASGVAVLIELAYLLKRTTELNCDVELVAYDAEEWGLWGSRYHAKKIKNQNVDVVYMFCLDMVGYFSDADNSQRYPVPGMGRLYGTKGDFLAMVGRPEDAKLMLNVREAFQKTTTLKTQSFPAPNLLEPLFARSDHAPFWWEGYPALFLTDTADFRNPHYHRRTDTWNTLDYDRFSQVPVGLYHAVLAIDGKQ